MTTTPTSEENWLAKEEPARLRSNSKVNFDGGFSYIEFEVPMTKMNWGDPSTRLYMPFEPLDLSDVQMTDEEERIAQDMYRRLIGR